jgi:hypothetical protein
MKKALVALAGAALAIAAFIGFRKRSANGGGG